MTMEHVKQHLADLLDSGDEVKIGHANAILSLTDIEQSEDDFRTHCVAVPLIESVDGRWGLSPDADLTLVLPALSRDTIDDAPLTETATRDKLDAFLLSLNEHFQYHPLIPAMMLSTAQWLVFYKQDLFGLFSRGRANGKVLLDPAFTDADLPHSLARAKGDPIAWFYQDMVAQVTRARAAEQAELDVANTPEICDG